MNGKTKEQQQQRNALKHCQRIKAVYTECRRNLPHDANYTHIPMKLWEVIETMLNDETLPDTHTRSEQ